MQHYRHTVSHAVSTDKACEDDPKWVPIAGPQKHRDPVNPTPPDPSPPLIVPEDRDELLAFADEHDLDVNRRLGAENLRAEIVAAL